MPEGESIVRRVPGVPRRDLGSPSILVQDAGLEGRLINLVLKSSGIIWDPHWWGQEIDGSPSWAPTPVNTTLGCALALQTSRFLLQ